MDNISELLNKFQTAAGLLTHDELNQIKKFIMAYKTYRDIYRTGFNHEPLGLTLESQLDKIDWYIDFRSKIDLPIK